MIQCVLEYLERNAKFHPEKEAFEDGEKVYTYAQIRGLARKVGYMLAEEMQSMRDPIAVFMDKNIDSIACFFGTLYSGNFYCPLDSQMPVERISTIMGVLQPKVVLTDLAHKEQAESFAAGAKVVVLEDAQKVSDAQAASACAWEALTIMDPLYVLFTSGSTGVPKGVLVGQQVIVNYLDWLDKEFCYDSDDVFGNQAPLYFDVSMHDVYGTLYFCAKMVIIPQKLFAFPVKLIEYMNEKKISTFLWVPSAMGIVATLKTFDAVKPEYLKHAMFAGEVLPRKQLDYWVENLPDVVYANLYGPTETFVCTGYVRTGKEPEGQPLPIGKALMNTQALVLDENGKEVAKGETGELCMRGCCVALGYYHNPEKTAASFTQNPTHDRYPDRIYHTGDLVYYDENDDLIYVSRKDFQIKHMGYRIELGEIETAAYQIEEVRDCACTYNMERKKIILYYDGVQMDKKEMLAKLSERIPQYMLPNRMVYLEQMPHNANGKIDRKALNEM